MSRAKIKWEKKAPGIFVAIATKRRVDIRGHKFNAQTGLRISKEKSDGRSGFRVDFCSAVAGAWMPWEPVDDTYYRTLASAKKAAREFVEAEPSE